MQVNYLSDQLNWSDGTQKYISGLKNKVSDYEDIIIFGAGIGGKQTWNLLQENGEGNKIKAFSDNNKNKIGTLYLDLPVISPNELNKRFKDALIIISSTAFDCIKKQLITLGLAEKNMYYFQPAGFSLQDNQDKHFIQHNMSKFEEVYQLLADEKSKTIYMCLLNYKITKDEYWLKLLKKFVDDETDQYFDKELLRGYLFENDFVDAGAYTGDTLDLFLEHFPQWQQGEGVYWLLEAEETIYKGLCSKIEKLQHGKYCALKYAVWDKEGEVRFDSTSFGNGAGSRVGEKGPSVKSICLDKLLWNRTVSFIKMDIEGAEKKALLGARNLISRDKPILTICIYHKPEDFFEIPLLITDMISGEYTFYVRQYRYGQSETVLYALPKSKIVRFG